LIEVGVYYNTGKRTTAYGHHRVHDPICDSPGSNPPPIPTPYPPPTHPHTPGPLLNPGQDTIRVRTGGGRGAITLATWWQRQVQQQQLLAASAFSAGGSPSSLRSQ